MEINFNKYKYLFATYPEVPKPWEPIILDMLKQIDKNVKSKYIPRTLLNFISKYPVILSELMPNVYITKIKQKFGTLGIYGVFTKEIQVIVDETKLKCNNTCEFCGSPNTTHVMVKGWVRNLCSTCKEVKKYGTNI